MLRHITNLYEISEKTSVGTSTFSDNTSSSEIAVTNFEGM